MLDNATIQYTLEKPVKIEVGIYNHLGLRIGNLDEGMKPAGMH